ncbi:precorrin-6y C5,15-methyltransferase (decarboxylating) subunit CbiE [Antrihabitans sp. NCIMB 15449]|uniref:Precorrin-6y C5,15-methyltransferase (Decarboxylating) subunit CbiE n=1 Tax=Antrihabitans spumae TaxID=3373370 RepID=A0ABW7JS12_9NOCA
MTERVVVVGIGADGVDGLSRRALRELAECDVQLGSRRQLELVDVGSAERVAWPTPLVPALPGLFDRYAQQRICVLASGDPMFHGIGVTLARLLGADRLEVLPQASSVSLACARLGWAVADTAVVSLVERPVETLLPALYDAGRIVVLSRGAQTPGEVAELLCANGFGASTVSVLEQLGGPAERRVDGVAQTWEHPVGDALNVVAVTCVAEVAGRRLTRIPGLPDDVFGGDGQLTKQEVRALTLSALAPAPGELLWDVGAGSGSIAIEWCRTSSSCRAIAFEHVAARVSTIEDNARALGVPGVTVRGAAPADFDEAPAPDAIFVGGGVTVPGLLEACWDRLAPGGRLVANAVTAESEALLVEWSSKFGGTLRRLQVHRGEPLGRFTTWRPQLPVAQLILGAQEAMAPDDERR